MALPLTVGMIQSAWTDVYSAAFFAAWLVLRREHRRWAILALALCLCVKPTILVGLIPFLVWSSRARRELLLAVPAALVVIVPFALATGVGQFLYDVIGVQAAFGNRYDGLDLLSYLWSQLGVQSLPLWLGLLATGIAAVTALARRPRDLAETPKAGSVKAVDLMQHVRRIQMNFTESDQPVGVLLHEGFGTLEILGINEQERQAINGVKLHQ